MTKQGSILSPRTKESHHESIIISLDDDNNNELGMQTYTLNYSLLSCLFPASVFFSRVYFILELVRESQNLEEEEKKIC